MLKSVAIIGAGFSGTMTAVHLMRLTLSPLEIFLIEKDSLGRGLAYADQDLSLLLNVRADQMGAFSDDIGHFYEWLKSKKTDCLPSDFMPRKIYGDYLTELLESAIADSTNLVKLVVIKDQVVDITPDHKVHFENHETITVSQVVLALGLKLPAEISYTSLSPSTEPITIIGTGLSMVDAVVYLQEIHYPGKITAVSRRGRMPLPHQFYEASIARPVYDFSAEHSLKFVLSTIREHLKNFEWRLVIDALRSHNQFLWSHWSERERSQFLRLLRPFWDVHRHRISPLHHQLITKLINEGKLEILRVGFKPYTHANPLVLKCHGPKLLDNPLVQKLLSRELVKSDRFNLGIESEKNWIHTIGPLTRGQLWESTAVPEIRGQAQDLATELILV